MIDSRLDATPANLARRLGLRCLLAGGAGWLAPWSMAATFQSDSSRPEARLLAAWDDAQGRHFIGLLAAGPSDTLRVLASLSIPTRAHGLTLEREGSVLVAARRPGEWFLRWWPEGRRPAQWVWSEADRRFNGHALAHASGQWICTVEADQESGQSLVVRRHARTLAKEDEWPTGGVDAHQLLWDGDGALLVANGGVPSLPETGRAKRQMHLMASSLVRLDTERGRQTGQWRLDDARLSLRHLVRHARGDVGLALQAEHDDPAARAAAPVLAVWDGDRLRTHTSPRPLAGYGGDIMATALGFVVSTPKADGVACWSVDGRWQGFIAVPEACALTNAAQAQGAWIGSRGAGLAWDGPESGAPQAPKDAEFRLDNHWVLMPS